MASFKDLLIRLPHLRTFSDAVMSTASCGGDGGGKCRDDAAALRLKFCAMASILVSGVIGVSIPLVGKKRRLVSTDSGVFLVFKAFAAGVILATGFVHMLPDGEKALTDPCLPKAPWEEFPFAGFVAMVAALLTLVLEFVGTQFYEAKKREEGRVAAVAEEECGGIEVQELVGCEVGSGSGVGSNVRPLVVSQILELGIVSHSVIIGLSLGVSHSPCTIRPLIGALSFHQFFEGFALGGCISQAKFGNLAATSMACFFAVTTPTGIAFGAALSSFYNRNSPRALVVEGIFDCISAGILIYMSLVDLIAADFLSSSTRHNVQTQAASYFALFLGAASMSLLAIWA